MADWRVDREDPPGRQRQGPGGESSGGSQSGERRLPQGFEGEACDSGGGPRQMIGRAGRDHVPAGGAGAAFGAAGPMRAAWHHHGRQVAEGGGGAEATKSGLEGDAGRGGRLWFGEIWHAVKITGFGRGR